MTSTRSWAALASVGLAVSAATVASVSPASAAGSSARATLAGSLTPSSERAKAEGRVAAGASVSCAIGVDGAAASPIFKSGSLAACAVDAGLGCASGVESAAEGVAMGAG